MPGKWHYDMEKCFPLNMREVRFYCGAKNYNNCRIADILLNNNRTCEIQHSYISENEIVNRFNDWNQFGKEIIWFIDGNEGIDIECLSTGNYLITFKQTWKYKSFMKTYDFILLEKDGYIFKIELKKIRSGMIELKEHQTIQDTINYLTTKPEQIWDYWSDENVVKSTLSIYQQGAGNGKTYGIWKSITENVDKSTFIIVTKQHSAKTVIFEELNDQRKRFQNGEEVYHIENITDETSASTDKHYVIKYTHKQTKKECIAIIGTVDSFCYNLCHSTAKGANFFKNIVDNIVVKGATKIQNGYMKYGGQFIQLSKQCEIWIDEVQDLPENYLHAMCKLMYETSCYINVVGDKLQSLEFENNFLTNIVEEGLPNIIIDVKAPINKNRRIKVTNMSGQINNLVKFSDYNLPIIECDDEIPKEDSNDPIEFIDMPIIYANDNSNPNKQKVHNFCDKVMKCYQQEVENNNYLPSDFLIIFPIMKSNSIASELQTKIHEYWAKKYDLGIYTQFVILHKHTEGTVINTNDSIDSTRIMSIKASKGDGRNVVFALGITESSLKLVSNKKKSLVYESHLHVALTRAKRKIYFGLLKNNDDIYRRFVEVGHVEYLPKISKKIILEKVYQLMDKTKFIQILDSNATNFENIMKNEIKVNTQNPIQVDWGYHCIKYQTFYFNVILNIITNKNKSASKTYSQLFVILSILSRYNIRVLNVKEYYQTLTDFNLKEMPYFPLCKLSDKPEYDKYFRIIKTTMLKIQQSINDNKLNTLNVYESIILTYMIQIETCRNYAEISTMDIYNITDFFQSNASKEQALLNNLANIQNIIGKSGINDFSNVNWNIFKHVELFSRYDSYFKLYKSQLPIIGNNDTDVVHIILKSDISQLNFWDTMVQILLERFLIYNPKSDKDTDKFQDKKINTYIFLLDKNSVIKIDWDWDQAFIQDIKTELKHILDKYYQSNHYDIFQYFSYIKDYNNEEWQQQPEKIIDKFIKLAKDNNYPEYIVQVFNDINTKIEEGESIDYIHDYTSFHPKLNNKLHIYLKKYLHI